jgi:hypothetical protein
MEEMKWFSSAMLGALAANNLGFGLALLGIGIFQTFLASGSAEQTMACQ